MNALTAGFGLGHQAAKGTAAASYVRARADRSSASPEYRNSDPRNQHPGLHERPTARQSTPIRLGYRVPISFASRLYPYLFGYALIGAGFSSATVANGDGSYTHTLTLADADAQSYLSVLRALNEGGNRFTQEIADVKLSALNINANRDGITYDGQGFGLSLADAGGGETETQDPDYEISPYAGSFSVTSSDITEATLGTPRTSRISIANPLSEDEQDQHSLALSKISSNGGATVTGVMSGLELSENILGEMYFGGAGNTTATAHIPEAQLVWSWQSAANMPDVSPAAKFSVQFTIPTVQMTMQPVDVSGAGTILYDCNWEMLDLVAGAPITVAITSNRGANTAD